ncbi:MAG: hypothetical protein U5L96_16310 [Owenweeksia sp.]|nr:hypothetical protein [Owenweeksia sp.]
MQLFKTCGHPLEELRELRNTRLKELFPACTTIDNGRYNRLMQYFEKLNQARGHPRFTFLYHYQEYQQQEVDAYRLHPVDGALPPQVR